MKRTIVSASVIALLASVLTLTGDVWSQNNKEPAAAAPSIPHKVGLIDMAHVFKHYKKFEFLREELKGKITEGEERAKDMQQKIVAQQTTMKTFTEGSAEYLKIEKDLFSKAAEFENYRRQMSREFMKQESQIYVLVYNEVQDMVKKYALHFKYTLVMKFNREDPETDNPTQAMQSINRPVVYYRGDDDITKPVLDSLNKKFKPESDTAPAKNLERSASGASGNLR